MYLKSDVKELISIEKIKNNIFNILIIILALLFFRSIYKNNAKKVASLLDSRNAHTKKNELLASIDHSEKTVKKLKNIINNKSSSSILNNIGNFAKEFGLNIISLKPQTQITYANYSKEPVDLVISAGSYHVVGKFISRLENSTDLYVIESLKINRNPGAKKSDSLDKLKVSLKLSTYFIKD